MCCRVAVCTCVMIDLIASFELYIVLLFCFFFIYVLLLFFKSVVYFAVLLSYYIEYMWCSFAVHNYTFCFICCVGLPVGF